MKKPTTKQNESKQPKTVQLSVIAPWILVLVLISAFAGVVSGWNWRSVATAEIEQSVALSLKSQAR